MGLRDVVLTLTILGSVPFCLVRPWIGILMWAWIGLMNPHRLTWGFAGAIPFAMVVGVFTLVGLVFSGARRPLPRIREVYILTALWAWFLMTTIFAAFPEEAWQHFFKVSKILLMVYAALMLCQEPRKCRALVWVMAMSIGYYGFKGGIWAIMTGGGNQVLGPEGSFISGNTEIGTALNMVLPLFLFFAWEAKETWRRWFYYAVFGFSVVSVLITYSRGAFLGLVVVMTFLLLRSRKRVAFALILAVAVPLAAATLPGKWRIRMETIREFDEESSATSRLQTWEVGVRIALDHPVLGLGFRPFRREIFDRYLPEYPMEHDAHSIYIQVLAEHGFPGLALFAGLLGSTLLSLQRVRRLARSAPPRQWIGWCAGLLQVGLAGYAVSGVFLSLSYFDLYYYIVAAAVLLQVLVRQPIQQDAAGGRSGGPKPGLAARPAVAPQGER